MTILLTLSALWAVSGFLAYGAAYADLRDVPVLRRIYAPISAVMGPYGLIAAAIATGLSSGRPFRHGFMWRAR